MDILSLQPIARVVDVLHPSTRAPIGLKITIQSMDSEPVKAVERVLRNKAIRSGRNSASAEKIEDATHELLAATVTGWTWSKDLTFGEMKDPPMTKENVVKLFRAAPWVAKQLDDEHKDESSFFAQSGTTS